MQSYEHDLLAELELEEVEPEVLVLDESLLPVLDDEALDDDSEHHFKPLSSHSDYVPILAQLDIIEEKHC